MHELFVIYTTASLPLLISTKNILDLPLSPTDLIMAYSLKLIIFLTLLLAWTVTYTAAAEVLSSASTLRARLKLDDGESNCWESLLELQWCTGEIIMFLINGETNLYPDCCRAIRIIEHECWPSMLLSLGFTDEEGDIVGEYCDTADDDVTTHPSPAPPPNDQVPPAIEKFSMKLAP